MCLCAQAAGLLIRERTHPGVQLWASRPLIWVHANRASGVFRGCLSHIHSPGAEGGGAQEAMAAVESSLNSCCVPLFSLFLFQKFLLFKPLVQTSTWTLTQPSLALSQESCSRPCARAGGSAALVPTLVPRWSHGGPLLFLSTLLTV